VRRWRITFVSVFDDGATLPLHVHRRQRLSWAHERTRSE
jgi:hypothetical protein